MRKEKDSIVLSVCKDGVSMATYYGLSCIPKIQMLRSMCDNGYKFKLNGKAATAKHVMLMKEGHAGA